MSMSVQSLRRLVALFVGVAAMSATPDPSFAQDPFVEFFGGLFEGRPHHGPWGPREPRVRRIMPHRENRGPTYWHADNPRAGKQSESATDRNAPVTQPTFFVATVGDTLGLLLANGLKDGFSDRPDVSILRKGKESSGLVRDDFYDWPKAAKEIAADAQKINVAVVMLGSNDRQAIQQGGESYETLSPRWRELYAARVDAVIAAFKEKNIPVIWVGLPVMKNERLSADMAQLNEIYKARAAHAGVPYVDLWDALTDEHGQYSAFGPDINGQIVKLRSADGVHFTEAGARSVAHFVESEIKKYYDAYRQQAPVADTPAAPQPETATGATAPQQPVATAPENGQPIIFRSPVGGPSAAPTLPERPPVGSTQQLTGAGAATELAKRAPASKAPDSATPAQALARHVFIDGGDQSPRENRADDYSWRPSANPTPQPR
ncbi:MAG: DUF459 domain-containing protein [Alphaproteobacteria bacterium]|nr:DUF459 domain-containing protein [Alphaproteobacteria bacterium]MBM3641961.1 DUF459 domain-containing protein [Alphaproteobacteria bacterium]